MKRYASVAIATVLLLSTSTAFAHPGHGIAGFGSGWAHPFSGLDHLLAMVAVGLWAAQMSAAQHPHMIWALPAAFMAALAAGAGLAFGGLPLAAVETAVASSVLALGLFVALAVRVPAALSIVLTALFGLAHGYAHGSELPTAASPLLYATGFLLATACLHLTGLTLGRAAHSRLASGVQVLGVCIAVAGAGLLTVA